MPGAGVFGPTAGSEKRTGPPCGLRYNVLAVPVESMDIRRLLLLGLVFFAAISSCRRREEVSQPAAKAPPRSAREELAEGRRLLEEKGPGAAIEALSRAFELDPSLEEAGLLLAELQAGEERFQDVLQTTSRLEEARSKRPAAEGDRDWAKVKYLKGRALKELGRYEEAENALRESVRLYPYNASSRSMLASVLALREKHEEAIEHLKEAAKGLEAAGMLSGRDQIHYQIAQSYKALGRAEEAAEHLRIHKDLQEKTAELSRLERIAHNRPGEAGPLLDLANAEYRLGLITDAASHFQQAARNDPGDAIARAALAVCLSRLRRVEEAQAAVDSSMAIAETALGWYALAWIAWIRKDLEGASKAVARAQALGDLGDPFGGEIRELETQIQSAQKLR